jgi:hypothetical protein
MATGYNVEKVFLTLNCIQHYNCFILSSNKVRKRETSYEDVTVNIKNDYVVGKLIMFIQM